MASASASSVTTLTGLLETLGAQVLVLDMGRRVVPITRQAFMRFEKNEIAYPLPLLQQAWFGVLVQGGGTAPGEENQIVWFLRLPLDEVGQLVPAARDDLLHRLLGELDRRSDPRAPDSRGAQRGPENPYAFRPQETPLAAFHARVLKELALPPSRFYGHARAYLSGATGWEKWSFVGIQGLADVAARLDEHDNSERVAQAAASLPPVPLEALCRCLENHRIPGAVAEALLRRGRIELAEEKPDGRVLAACVRGISYAEAPGPALRLCREVLRHPCSQQAEILNAIAGRAWEQLREGDTALSFLERLAQSTERQEGFNRQLSELMFLPGLRAPLLQQLRNPERSARLSRAIGEFFRHLGHSDGGRRGRSG